MTPYLRRWIRLCSLGFGLTILVLVFLDLVRGHWQEQVGYRYRDPHQGAAGGQFLDGHYKTPLISGLQLIRRLAIAPDPRIIDPSQGC